ncbi:MAG: hypothetical protein WEC75_06530 [Dehalococcoidia bacterium]
MYSISLESEVARAVEGFPPTLLRYWKVFLDLIAEDPLPRFAQYSERLVPIRGFPWRTYNYEITGQESVSGERILFFTAEFLPEYIPVYILNEQDREAHVFSLRPGWP